MSEIQNDLFSSVPQKDFFGIFDNQGRPDSKKITDILGYKRRDISLASGIPLNKVRLEDNRIPRELLDRITEWGISLNLVAAFFQDTQKTILWFRASNPLLGNISPSNMIRVGRYKKLLKFIQTALAENTPY
ncbi:hypothetical protein KAI87_10765 [Myxococcota bacterium]|nr:hypothetical protein [Myxococcota bacterium]